MNIRKLELVDLVCGLFFIILLAFPAAMFLYGYLGLFDNYDEWFEMPVAMGSIAIALGSFFLLSSSGRFFAITATFLGIFCGYYWADEDFSEKELIYRAYYYHEGIIRPCVAIVLKDGPDFYIDQLLIRDSEKTELEFKLIRVCECPRLNAHKFKYVQRDYILNGQYKTIPFYDVRLCKDYDEYLYDVNVVLVSKIHRIRNSYISDDAKQEMRDHLLKDLNLSSLY